MQSTNLFLKVKDLTGSDKLSTGASGAIYNIDLRSIGGESWNIQKVDYCG